MKNMLKYSVVSPSDLNFLGFSEIYKFSCFKFYIKLKIILFLLHCCFLISKFLLEFVFHSACVLSTTSMSDVQFAEHCEKLTNIRLFVPCQIPPIKRCTCPLSSTYWLGVNPYVLKGLHIKRICKNWRNVVICCKYYYLTVA